MEGAWERLGWIEKRGEATFLLRCGRVLDFNLLGYSKWEIFAMGNCVRAGGVVVWVKRMTRGQRLGEVENSGLESRRVGSW